MVGSEDADPVSPVPRYHVECLIYGVSSALEPVFAAPHLGRNGRYEEVASAHCSPELPASFDMLA